MKLPRSEIAENLFVWGNLAAYAATSWPTKKRKTGAPNMIQIFCFCCV